MKLSLVLTPGEITRFFLKIIGILLLANLISNYLKWEMGYETALGVVPLFDFDQEYNIPTFYSFLAILFCAGLLWFIGMNENIKKDSKKGQYWKGLSLVFLFLGLDELMSIHNHFGRIVPALMDVSQYLNPSRHWVVVYVPLLLFFAFFFWRFFFRLPKKTMLGFAVAGLVFIGGAVGMEIAGDQYMMYRAEPDIYYGLISTAEEVLEMVGIVLFIRAMVFHISVYCQEPKLNIQLITVSGPEKKQPINGVPKMKIKSKGKMEKMTQGKIISLDYSK